MKKRLVLLTGTIFYLLLTAAFGAEPASFSLKGIELGQSKSALGAAARFDCSPNTDTPDADELCTAESSAGPFPVLVNAWLRDGLVTGLMLFQNGSDHAAFFNEAVKTATKKYGAPQSRNNTANGELLDWRHKNQRYVIVHGATGRRRYR